MHSVSCNVSPIPHCCGVLEIGDVRRSFHKWSAFQGTGDTFSDAFSALLSDIMEAEESYDEDDGPDNDKQPTKGYALQTWFYKSTDMNGTPKEEYYNSELRELVRAIPNVVHLGAFVNSNSGNIVDGYFWFNNTKEINE